MLSLAASHREPAPTRLLPIPMVGAHLFQEQLAMKTLNRMMPGVLHFLLAKRR
jgi:hypothetical protein